MNFFGRIAAFVVCAAATFFVIFCAYPKTTGKTSDIIATGKYKAVLTLWHVDSFEGGVGSRADFLSSALLKMRNDGVIVLVKSQTVESMRSAISNGELPDLVSLGGGCADIMKFARELPVDKLYGGTNLKGFAGGEKGGKYYAAPWCFGGYYLIVKSEDNRLIEGFLQGNGEKNVKKLVVSQGENTLPMLALKTAGVTATDVAYYPPYDAYVNFLGQSEAVLLGTQRDLRRLEKRGAAFSAVALEGFSDIVQYVAVTTKADEKYAYCLNAVKLLLDETVQAKLGKIGMMRAVGNTSGNTSGSLDGNEAGVDFYGYDFLKNEYTASVFLSEELIRSAQSELKGKNGGEKLSENVKNGLKNLK